MSPSEVFINMYNAKWCSLFALFLSEKAFFLFFFVLMIAIAEQSPYSLRKHAYTIYSDL